MSSKKPDATADGKKRDPVFAGGGKLLGVQGIITKGKDKIMLEKHMVREEMAGYNNGAIVLYQSPDGSISIDVRLEKETLWMDAHQMARLFGRDRSVIVRHIRNIYDTSELDQASTYAKNAQVAADGKLRQMDLYNLDVIIGVGYRVNNAEIALKRAALKLTRQAGIGVVVLQDGKSIEERTDQGN